MCAVTLSHVPAVLLSAHLAAVPLQSSTTIVRLSQQTVQFCVGPHLSAAPAPAPAAAADAFGGFGGFDVGGGAAPAAGASSGGGFDGFEGFGAAAPPGGGGGGGGGAAPDPFANLMGGMSLSK